MTGDREQRTMAAGVLLSIAQDENVRPGLRIHAARSVMIGPAAGMYDGCDTDTPEDVQDDAEEDLVEKIAYRVAAKLKETL